MTYIITIPGRMPSLNEWNNGHKHWRQKGTDKRDWHTILLYSFKSQGLPKALRCPISVKSTQHTVRMRDVDNCVPSVKYLLDALVEGKYIEKDNPQYVESVSLRWAKAIKEEKVVYEITEVDDPK